MTVISDVSPVDLPEMVYFDLPTTILPTALEGSSKPNVRPVVWCVEVARDHTNECHFCSYIKPASRCKEMDRTDRCIPTVLDLGAFD